MIKGYIETYSKDQGPKLYFRLVVVEQNCRLVKSSFWLELDYQLDRLFERIHPNYIFIKKYGLKPDQYIYIFYIRFYLENKDCSINMKKYIYIYIQFYIIFKLVDHKWLSRNVL